MKSLAALAALLTLGGCAGARPEVPRAAQVQPPVAWRSAEPGREDIAPDWWRAYGDPRLASLIEAALARNTDIELASARVEEARAQYQRVHSQQLPSVFAQGAGARDRGISAFGIPVEQWGAQGGVAISYELDLFGRLANSSAAAKAALFTSSGSREAVRLAVVASVARGYIALLAADERLLVLQQTLGARAEALRIARRRAEAGYTSELELQQAEAEYRSTEQLIAPTRQAIAQIETGLNVLLGDNPAAIERGSPLQSLSLPSVPGRLPSELLRRRPDIVAAEHNIVAAERSLDSARAAFMPRIQLGAEGAYVASSLLTGDPFSIFSLGGSLLAPLFEGGRLRAEADIAAARRDQAAFAYRRTALIAFKEVEDALAAIQRTREKEEVLTAQREAAAKTLRLATNRYQAGYASYLEQIDAQRNLLGVDLALAQARADRLNASVDLFQGLGGGWRPEEIE